MISLIAAQALLFASFEPPLIFDGESFKVQTPQNAIITHAKGVRIGEAVGKLLNTSAEFWLEEHNGGTLVDAVRVEIPAAMVERWRDWPSTGGWHNGAAFLVGLRRSVALVPMRDNYGICVLEHGVERRHAELVTLDVAARSGPRHKRPVRADAIYAGLGRITIYAQPERVATLTIELDTDAVVATIVANYSLQGSVAVLGESSDIKLAPGQTKVVRRTF